MAGVMRGSVAGWQGGRRMCYWVIGNEGLVSVSREGQRQMWQRERDRQREIYIVTNDSRTKYFVIPRCCEKKTILKQWEK